MPGWSRAALSPPGRACRPTCATPAPTGLTRKSTSTRGSSPAANRKTWKRSRPRSSRSSPRACTWVSAPRPTSDNARGGGEGDATARSQKRQQTRPPVQTHQEEREGRGTLGGAGGGNRRPHRQQGKGELRRNEELVAAGDEGAGGDGEEVFDRAPPAAAVEELEAAASDQGAGVVGGDGRPPPELLREFCRAGDPPLQRLQDLQPDRVRQRLHQLVIAALVLPARHRENLPQRLRPANPSFGFS